MYNLRFIVVFGGMGDAIFDVLVMSAFGLFKNGPTPLPFYLFMHETYEPAQKGYERGKF